MRTMELSDAREAFEPMEVRLVESPVPGYCELGTEERRSGSDPNSTRCHITKLSLTTNSK